MIILKRVVQLAFVVISIVIVLFVGTVLLNMRYKAVYLTPANGGQLSYQDLRNHPEVRVVHNGYQLILSSIGNKAIWVDKDSVQSINNNVLAKTWLNISLVKYHPMVLVGYNNALYSFRDYWSLGYIAGPYVDWKKVRLEPGFSVWKLAIDAHSQTSGFMKGYDQTFTVEDILRVTNKLLEGKTPS